MKPCGNDVEPIVPKLYFERANNVSVLSKFYCGVTAIDDFVHSSEKGLQKYLDHHLSNLWIVKDEEKLVAFFAISSDTITLNYQDRYFMKMGKTIKPHIDADFINEFWEKDKYPSIGIDFFAVEQNSQHRGIGKFIINQIAQKVLSDNLAASLFLTVDAYHSKEYSAIGFYKKCDFVQSEVAHDRYPDRAITTRMYKAITYDEKLIK
jgi:GNAT superfamily N-acetyltransferase